MVKRCCVKGCGNESYSGCNISFHSFPKDEQTKQKWLQIIPVNVAKHTVVCSRHFKPADFTISCSRKVLVPKAVPSILPVPRDKKVTILSDLLIAQPHTTTPGTSQNEQKISGEPSIKKKCLDDRSSMAVQTAQSSLSPLEDRSSIAVQTAQSSLSPSNEEFLRRKVKLLSQRLKRRETKIESQQQLLALIKTRCHNFDEVNNMVTNNFNDVYKHINTDKNNKGVRYAEEVKEFALSLYYYSPKAYLFMRNHISLPHPATLRRMLSTHDCNVGFMVEVIEFLKETAKNTGDLKDVALIFDGMSIKAEIASEKNSDKTWGYVDFGGIVSNDAEDLATQVLVLQIVSFRRKFKCPIGYFLINKISANVQAQLILTAIRILHSISIIVRSLTCDGTRTNVRTYEILGCNFNFPGMVTSFKHPLQDTQVHCIFDPPHMIKLCRNIFAETNLSTEKGKVDFKFVKLLHELQEKEGLRLANKLCNAHVNFFQKKMNVKLAVQVISSSVADALEFLRQTGSTDFEGNEATVEYIRYLDRVFDLLNAKDPFGKGFKSPLRLSNAQVWTNVLSETRNYLLTLNIDDRNILNHKRKMAILGLIVDTYSFKNLAMDLLEAPEDPLSYFLPYKCSQDHIEMFFSCIRRQGGHNDNPNALAFRYALRKLLYTKSIKPSINANCVDDAFESNPIFECRSLKRSTLETVAVSSNDNQRDRVLCDYLESCTLSDYKMNVIHYIAGNIVNKLLDKISCEYCRDSLITVRNTDDHNYCLSISNFSSFTTFVDRGGLKYVSKFAFEVVKYSEKLFVTLSSQVSCVRDISKNKMLVLTMEYFSTRLSNLISNIHPLQSIVSEDSHEMQLVKLLATSYINLRMFHYVKLKSMAAIGKKIGLRQKLHKTILFSNL